MSSIRVACQTYTWEMLGDAWQGRVVDLLDWIAAAGYDGIEISNRMIGEHRDRPLDFARELQCRGLSLAAFAYSSDSGFTDPSRREADLEDAKRVLEFVATFPEPHVGLGGAASHGAGGSRARQLDEAIAFYNAAGALAKPLGVAVSVHPHSHHGSVIETATEYAYLVEHLDPDLVSLGPDTGHIVRSGQDLLACLRRHMGRITHLHLKDATADRRWVGLGEGVCDFPAVLALLEQAGYRGWIVAEEESEAAREDGVAAIRRNRAYLRSLDY